MRFPLSLALMFSIALPAFAQPKPPDLPPNLVAPTDALSPEDERKQFTLPEGFDAQLVASEPDIQKPMQIAFDAKGRLWVTTSHHYPFAAPSGKCTDKLFVLSDIDPATGKAGKVQVFAQDLNIPIGILPLPDCKSCIVSSVGEIRKYTDTDGDGKSDRSEVLFTGFGSVDTHGMTNSYTLMPDGWVYACHGFRNDSAVKGKDGHEVKMNSGHTFRFRPDGSRIEVWTRGQVNPFGMTVDPWFNLYTADCHSKPITQLIPGAYYQSFGKPHDGLGFAPHVTTHAHGSTGLCGVSWYDADHFPKEFLGTMFVGNVVTNRINFDRIEWRGASPVAKELPDFLVSKDRWFRPTDIKLGPDGALYVSDFYNKIVGHYEVDLKHPGRDHDHGRIWRIVWKGKDGKAPAPKFAFGDLTKDDVRDVYQLLDSPNITVRLLATNQLIHRSDDMTHALKTGIITPKPFSERGSSHAAWRGHSQSIDASGITGVLTAHKEHHTPFAIAHELRMAQGASKWDDKLRAAVIGCFKDGVHVQRAAVEAVIAHPHADFVKPLVELLAKCPADDTHLRHAVKVALRNCLRDAEKWPGGDDPALVDVAVAIPTRTACEYLVSRMKGKTIPPFKLPAMAEHVARYGSAADEEFAFTLVAARENTEALLAAFRGVQARGEKLRPELARAVRERAQDALTTSEFLTRPDNAKRGLWGVQALNALPAAVGDAKDLKLGADAVKVLGAAVGAAKAPDEIRIGAAEVLLKYSPADARTAIRAQLAEPSTPEAVRTGLLLAAASSNNPDAQQDARDALATVPYRVAVPVGLALASTKHGSEHLLNAVRAGKAPARLLQESALLFRLKASNAPDWEKRVAELTKNIPAADQRIAAILKTRGAEFAKAKPDRELGEKLFTKHCAACHKIGDAGGKIAPQLDGVGVRGAERLLEDILDPNRNVDSAFRARSITLTDDKTLTALMLRVEGKVLVVADLEGKERQIPLKDIAINRETQLSAMPANFADVIPEADLYHIVAYLLEQKAKEPPKKE